jgi:hypothetical protein
VRGFGVVLVFVVVVVVAAAACGSPELRCSYVLRVCVGVWGCAFDGGGGEVVHVVVGCGGWYLGSGGGIVAIFGVLCVFVGGVWGIVCVVAMGVGCVVGDFVLYVVDMLGFGHLLSKFLIPYMCMCDLAKSCFLI